MSEREKQLEAALKIAADDLYKASNQFASMRASQEVGHYPEVNDNPEIFAAKAIRAYEVLGENYPDIPDLSDNYVGTDGPVNWKAGNDD